MELAMTIAKESKYAHLADPGIREFLLEGDRLYPPEAVNFTVEQQRQFYDRYCAHFNPPLPETVEFNDFGVGEIACRRYEPANTQKCQLLYLHGGGFVVGGIASHNSICAELAEQTGLTTVAVQYRLAPENPFPAAFDDCWAVLRHITSGGQPVVIAGDSAGGNLAAALCLRARDQAGPAIKGQVLIYPGLGGDTTKGSYISKAGAPGLTTKDIQYYRKIYRGIDHPYAGPLKASDHSNLPPAFLVAAGEDPLHDDCQAYAAKLKASGVAAEVRDEPLLVHAFLRARHMSEPAAKSFSEIIAAIRRFAA
jgi:acetyl esterase